MTAHPFSVLAAVSAGQRWAVHKATSPLCRPRNKRYNTLDLASKIVCQRRTSRPSFVNLPDTGSTISLREIGMLLPVFIFPDVLQN